MKRFQFFPLVVPYRTVLAFPLSYTSTVTAIQSRTYVPLIVIFVSLFFLVVLFLAIKLVYMKRRRIGSIHASRGTARSIPMSGFGFRDKPGNRHRGLLVGCLGSPTWETSLRSKLDGANWRREQRRRSSFAYQLHTHSTRSASARSRSKNSNRLTDSTAFSGYSSRLVLLSSFGSSRVPGRHGGSTSEVLLPVEQNTSTRRHLRYGDFGEFHDVRSPEGGVREVARRASPSSIRLVDGPNHSSQVEYSFLSALPPNAVVASPLMGTRDSFQLSRCSLQCHRKPVPPMPLLPSFLPFHLPRGPETLESRPLEAREYLHPLRFSPLASVAKVFNPQQQIPEKKIPRSREVGPWTSPCVTQEIPTLYPIRKTNYKRSPSCKGLAIGGSLPRSPVVTGEVVTLPLEDKKCSEVEPTQTGILRNPSGSSRNGSDMSKKPLKSCLRQHSVVPMPLACSPDSIPTPSMSETSTQIHGTRRSTGDQASLRTPISDDEIGMLGLDRFHWNEEIKELDVRSSHMKKDSVALAPVWE